MGRIDDLANRYVDEWAPLDPIGATYVGISGYDSELTDLSIKHQWHLWSGDHSAVYWSAHLEDYLRFSDASLSSRVPTSSLS